MCLLLGASGVGKTLLVKRLHRKLFATKDYIEGLLTENCGHINKPGTPRKPELCSKESADLGDAPPTQPTVGTNLTDLTIQRSRVTIREVGGSMGPIWPSYYKDCRRVMFLIDAANPVQVSASCMQLLGLLSAPELSSVSVLIIFNKRDLPTCMSLVEMKSLFRLDDIIACARQPITVVETSALQGTGLQEVLQWLHLSGGS